MAEQPPEPENRHLLGWGEVQWERLATAATGLTCAWADYDGFHIGHCPPTAPPYSHIWGWSRDGSVLMRGRINGTNVTVGWLHADSDADGEPVACVARPLIPWEEGHQRINPRLAESTSMPSSMMAVDVLDGMPSTFIGAW